MTFTFIIIAHTKEDAVSKGYDSFNVEPDETFHLNDNQSNVTSDSLLVTVLLLETQSLDRSRGEYGPGNETFHLNDSQSNVTSDSLLVTVLLLETQFLDRSRGEHGPGNLIWLSPRCITISGTLSHEVNPLASFTGDPDFDFHQPVQSSTPKAKQAKPKQPNLGKGKHASIVNCAKNVSI